MARALTVPSVSGESGLTRYLQEIRKFPMLAAEEEFMLAKRWREHGDTEAAHKLVTSHLRLVAKIAMGYRGYGLPLVRADFRGQCRHDAGGEAVRSGPRLSPRDLRDVVDPGRDPGIHPAFLVAGEDGHDGGAEEAILQPAQAQGPDAGDRRRRPVAGARDQQIATRLDVPEAGRRQHEPPARPAPTTRSMRRSASTATASGRIGWSTSSERQEIALAEREELGKRRSCCAERDEGI